MFAAGFLNSRSDFILDATLLIGFALVPMLFFAWKRARASNFLGHRNLMLITTAVLAVAVTAVEMDLRARGGLFVLTQGSPFHDTAFLKWSAWIHVFLSVVSAVIWCLLVSVSWFKFPKPPKPMPWSVYHRWLGRAALIGMALVAITGMELYVIAFVL